MFFIIFYIKFITFHSQQLVQYFILMTTDRRTELVIVLPCSAFLHQDSALLDYTLVLCMIFIELT